MGDIGKTVRRRYLEPIPETAPVEEPAPEEAPLEEPVPEEVPA